MSNYCMDIVTWSKIFKDSVSIDDVPHVNSDMKNTGIYGKSVKEILRIFGECYG